MSRREALATLGVAGLAGLSFRWPAPISRWGIQLYTVRSLLQRDFDGTLKAIGQIGYKEVETAGYYNRSPADVRKALDAAGLAAPSAHVDLNSVDTGLPALLDACATIGHKWLVVPSLPRNSYTADGLKEVGEKLTKAAAAAKSADVRIAYHNHDVDFRPIGDSNGMELLLAASGPDVAAELDVYWIVKSGGDPLAFINKHRGRVKMLHLKDASAAPEQAMRDVGSGTIDWKAVLSAGDAGGVEHAFVEHDNPGADPIASAKASFEYLSHLKR